MHGSDTADYLTELVIVCLPLISFIENTHDSQHYGYQDKNDVSPSFFHRFSRYLWIAVKMTVIATAAVPEIPAMIAQFVIARI
jgi:hypothetical protein